MIMESVNVVFDDSEVVQQEKDEEEEEEVETTEPRITREQASTKAVKSTEAEGSQTVLPSDQPNEVPRVHMNHSVSDVIGNVNEGRRTRGVKINYREMVQSACFVSNIEPRDHTEALADEFCIQAMQEEIEQFVRNEVLELLEKPVDGNIVGTKWIFKNKIDET